MALIEKLYERLAHTADPAVDRSLAAALPTADAQAQARIVHLLLDRQHRDGCAGLILHYHKLDESLRALIDEQAVTLSRSMRMAASLPQTAGPGNTLRIIGHARSPKLADLVTEQLRRSQTELAEPAAECLHLLARVGKDGSLRSAREVRGLSHAVEEAVVHFGVHKQPHVLLAYACLLPGSVGPAAEALGDANHEATEPMRRLLANSQQRQIRRVLFWALAQPTLAEPALAGLRQSISAKHFGDALESAHLLRLRSTRRPLLRSKSAQQLWPDAREVSAMPTHQRRQLPAWLDALPLDAHDRAARLMDLASAPDRESRLAVLRRLLVLARENPGSVFDEAVARFVTDPSISLARIAVWHLIHCHYKKLPQVLGQLVNSPHVEIREIAARRLAPIGFVRLWENWDTLKSEQRVAAGRALIKIDPHFHRLLGDKLSQGDRDPRLRALGIISELNQGAFFTDALLTLAGDEDDYTASAAVASLGSCEDERAIPVLEAALQHEDSRVRANAIESLAQLKSSAHLHQLATIAADDDNRPRANAIGVLMELAAPEALKALQQMLADSRIEHRRSALWLVETMGLFDVARQIAEMSISDPDSKLRSRADRAVHDLIAMMHPKSA